MTGMLGHDTETVIDGDFEDISGLQADLDQELDAIFSEFGGDENVDEYEIKIYRTQQGKGALGYVFSCLPHELPILDKLRDEYGGGDFEVRILKNKKIFRRRKVIVEPPRRPPPAQTANSDLLNLVHTINQGFNQLREHLAAIPQPAPPAVDPIAMQTSLLQSMLAMKELLTPGQPAATTDFTSQMKSFVEIQKLLLDSSMGGRDAGAEDVLLGLANNLLPQLAEMGKQEQQYKQTQAAVAAKAIPAKKTQPTAQHRPNPMKNNIIFLTQMAKNNVDPMVYAQVVLDNTPPDQWVALAEFIAAPDAIKKITELHPPAGEYPGWFAELGQCVLSLLQGPDDSELSPKPHTNKSEVAVTPQGVTGTQVFHVPGTATIADSPHQDDEPAPTNT
jgi:hypothetical protein